jgi:hypothetical protein
MRAIWDSVCGAGAIALAFLTPFLQSRRERWGATDAEVVRPLPGDNLVPHSSGGYTHAVTIRAPAAEVWRWLVQIGQGRGGFYSYDLLENMVGCRIHSAGRIVPELQNLDVDQRILIHPAGAGYTVAAVEPERHLVLLERADSRTKETFELAATPERYVNQGWAFFLEEQDGTTRLISRSRNDWDKSLTNRIVYGMFGPISLLMDRKMLLGIKRRAEAAHA